MLMAPTGETRRLGVHSCTCVHLCPVCWARRRIQERAEIVFAGGLWLAAGAGLATASLTVPHEVGEPLATVTARVDSLADYLRAGRARAELRDLFGVEAILRASEVTHSWRSGWHPHQHLLLWLREPWDEPMQAGVREWWRRQREKWRKRRAPEAQPERDPRFVDDPNVELADLGRLGGHITKGPSRTTLDRYYDAEDSGNFELADYLGDFVPEPLKRPRPVSPGGPAGPGGPSIPGPGARKTLAPFELGALAAAGDVPALRLFAEYEQATANTQWIRWPNGWRSRFGFGTAGRVPALEGEIVASVPSGLNRRNEGPVLERPFRPGVGG